MKNKITSSLLLLAGAFVLTSCNLDETPYGFYSEDNFYMTDADAEAAVLYAYGTLNYLEYSRNIFYLGDMPSEDMSPKSDASTDIQDISNWKVDNFKKNTMLENFFKYAFIGVNRANAVIKELPEAPISEENKNRYLGEAYFLRAWNYFNLVRNFGLVPLHNTVVESVGQTSTPLANSMDDMYDLILSDCKKAIDLLPVYNQPQMGRADKVAAEALAAKAFLYVASAKEHNVKLYRDMRRDATEMYDSAAYYAGEVINSQTVYGFEDNLLDIYDVDQPNGKEHIFLMSMDRSGVSEGQYSKISKMFIPYIDGATLYLKQGDKYIPTHDGFGEYRTTDEFYKSFDGNDKRKTELIINKIYDSDGNLNGEYPGTIPYPFSRKYIDPQFQGDKTSTRPFLLRFSDVALIYAEAAGPTQKSYELVNFIRKRAGLGELKTGMDKESFRKKVFKERTFELAFEGDHMYDLRRWNLILTDIPAAKGLSEDQVTFYPIPQAEINLNGSLK